MNYLVYDVGGTFIKYALMNEKGQILKKDKFPTPRDKQSFYEAVEQVYHHYQDHELRGIAFSLPGVVDVKQGIVYNGGGCPYLHEEPLVSRVEALSGLPAAIENDGKCAGLAEVWLGNAQDVQDAIVIVVGSAMAGAIIHQRQVLHGKHLIAGEISNVIIDSRRQDNKPTLFAHSATYGLRNKVARAKGLDFKEVSGERIYEWAKENDSIAIEALEDMYYDLAVQAYNFQYTYDPEVILFGGGISENPDFLPGIQRYVDRLAGLKHQFAKPVILPCRFNNDSNLIGALYHLKESRNV